MATWDEIIRDLEGDEESYNQSSMQYVNEIKQLRDKLNRCYDKISHEREKQENFKGIQSKDLRNIQILSKKVGENQARINSLKSRLAHVLASDPNKLHLPTTHVDPDLITFKAMNLVKVIEQDSQAAQQTGRYENVNARIAEVRKLFKICMIQLDDLNKRNRMVTGTLDCLINLDRTEETLRSLKTKYSINAPKITISG